MAGYNGAWTGPQIDEAVRQVTNKDLPADGVKFSDGQTFQQKYDAGQLTGPAGRDGTDGQDGAPGEPGTPGMDGAQGPVGPAGRGITGVTFSSATNKWTISYSDGSSEQVEGPAIPTQLSQLTGDSTHRTVTDAEKSAWNNKSDFDGNYNNLTNKPPIPTVSSSVSSSSTTTAASSSAVKQAYDKAVAAIPKSGGTFTGTVKAAGEGYQAPGTSLLRNTKLVSSDTTPTINGEIFWTYG